MNEEILKLADALDMCCIYGYEIPNSKLEAFYKAAFNAGIEAAAEECEKTRWALNENLAAGCPMDESYQYEWEQSACRGEEYAADIRALEMK